MCESTFAESARSGKYNIHTINLSVTCLLLIVGFNINFPLKTNTYKWEQCEDKFLIILSVKYISIIKFMIKLCQTD